MVEAAELPRALDGHDVEGLLDHAEHARVAARVGAHGAELALGEVEAAAAEADLLLDLGDGRRQRQDLVGPQLEHVEGEPLSGAWADPGQLRQLRDQPLDGW
jgi:hypothetical protein